MSTRSQISDLIVEKILTGGRRTTASNAREVYVALNESCINKTDDSNVANGYLAIDADGRINISFIKKETPTGQFLRDDGTWANGGAVTSVNGYVGIVVLDTSDIDPTTNRNYVTDAQLVVIGDTSGTNTGDQNLTPYALLSGATFTGGITATNLSGTNTGDQNLSGYAPLNNPVFTDDIEVQNELIVRRSAGSSSRALTINADGSDDVVFNSNNAEYYFNKSNVTKFKLTSAMASFFDGMYLKLGALNTVSDKYSYISSSASAVNGVGIRLETINDIGATGTGLEITKDQSVIIPNETASTMVEFNASKELKSISVANARTRLGIDAGTIIVTSGTSFTTPSTITTATIFLIELVGAGGGGGGRSTTNLSGSAGGGGGFCFVKVTGLTASTTYTCAIGTGGAGGADAANGNDGGNTTLTIGATTYTASGGIKGLTAASSTGGAGGTGTNGDINITGQDGASTASTASVAILASEGGDSPMGWGLGGNAPYTSLANNGSGYGGGGSSAKGTAANAVGGNGSDGIIYCEYFN